MNCATHSDIAAVAFCRTCGKPLCGTCTRDVRGVVYCEPCLAARLEGTAPAAGFVPPQTTYQQTVYPPVGAPLPPRPAGSGPNPAVAGILGAIPFGVGAVYNGQYAKGLAHLFIFVMLIYGANHSNRWDFVFGIGIAFFVIYQIIDAVRTAKALQIGQSAPDPLGLGQAFSMGERFDSGKIPVGAVVLIGLGVLFLLHTMGIIENGLDRFWPLILIFLGGWMFYRNSERARRTCSCRRCATRGLMGPAMVMTTGILFMLEALHIADLDRTWPAWILVVGIVKLLQSSASSEGHVGPLPGAPPATGPMPPPPPVPSSDPGTTSSSGEVRHV
jgi:cell wall-active antibiotic response 4TMS protein YvqF/B-box zinc finger protein